MGQTMKQKDRRIPELASLQQTGEREMRKRLGRLLPRNSRRRALYLILRRAAGVLAQEGLYSLLRKSGRRFRQALARQRPLLLIPAYYSLQELNAKYQVAPPLQKEAFVF